MTHKNTWKQGERRVADFFFSKRTPLSGGNSGHTRSDTLNRKFFVECKFKAKQAVWSLYRETAVLAKKENKLPVIALQEKGKPGFLLVIHEDHIWRFINTYFFEKMRHWLRNRKNPS